MEAFGLGSLLQMAEKGVVSKEELPASFDTSGLLAVSHSTVTVVAVLAIVTQFFL